MSPLFIIGLLALLLGFQPLTTDLYLPAMPLLAQQLNASVSQTQTTFYALILAFGCSQLAWGPASDRWGRRPILLAGIGLYVLAALGCVPREDALAAWQWLAQQHPHKPRMIFGHSLGGAIAIDLATRVDDEQALLVEGTFTNIRDMARSFQWGWLPVGPLITQKFDSLSKIKQIGSPLVVVHGSADALIPLAQGQQLYAAASTPKQWVLVEGGTHHSTNSVGLPQYRTALAQLSGLKNP